ncbi:MAG: hypothetical protein HYZ77_07980, partial [Serratia liquefaciens]|nr:hypothetical protein [Serratia liquefaciens]
GLRKAVFNIAADAESHCSDRHTLVLHRMLSKEQEYRVETGTFDHTLSTVVSVGREMFRLEKLEKIARNKIEKLYNSYGRIGYERIDEVEVHLGYQIKLRRPLELTTTTKEMLYFSTSRITPSDLHKASIKVKNAENSQFRKWLLRWGPLHNVLERIAPAEWELITTNRAQAYENVYNQLVATELAAANLTEEDTEALSAIGTKAAAFAENAFLKNLAPLVDRVFNGFLDAKWPL